MDLITDILNKAFINIDMYLLIFCRFQFIIMSILTNPMVLLASAFVAFVTKLLLNMVIISTNVPLLEDQSLNVLQSHPRCGITSGGREECWWKCERKIGNDNFGYFKVIFIIENDKYYKTVYMLF